jgi:hypothetical protein
VFLLSELKLPVCWSEAADGLGCGDHGPKCRLETHPPRFSAFLFFMRPVPGHHPVRGAFFFFALHRGPSFLGQVFSASRKLEGLKLAGKYTPPPFGGVGMEYLY